MIRSTHNTLLALATLALPAFAGPAAAQHAAPIRGAYTTAFTAEPTETPGVLLLRITGAGRAAHLGRGTTAGATLLDLRQNPPTQHGPVLFTAANGDQLFGVYDGISVEDRAGVIHLSGTVTFAGGTGRFREATGSAAVEGTASNATLTGQFAFRGRISLR